MAPPKRTPGDPVSDDGPLGPGSEKHGFVPLVAYLEELAGPRARARLGEDGPPEDEAIRLRHDPSLTFSAGDVKHVRDLRPGGDSHVAFEVLTTFLGVTGAVSPLPGYLPEAVAREDPDHPIQRDFLDIFHHRLLSLLYRLLSKYSPTREYRADGQDEWSRRIQKLVGVDPATSAATTTALPTWRLLRLAPLLMGRRSARCLALCLEDTLGPDLEGAHIDIVQFTGAWLRLPADQRPRLGQVNSRLGVDAILGARVADRAGRFRIVMGPASASLHARFRPGGDLLARLHETVALVLTDPIGYDIELVLSDDAVPALRLGHSHLSRDTWLGGRSGKQTRILLEASS